VSELVQTAAPGTPVSLLVLEVLLVLELELEVLPEVELLPEVEPLVTEVELVPEVVPTSEPVPEVPKFKVPAPVEPSLDESQPTRAKLLRVATNRLIMRDDLFIKLPFVLDR
jgi:hypothetical protein